MATGCVLGGRQFRSQVLVLNWVGRGDYPSHVVIREGKRRGGESDEEIV